jgi:hypothetical protein
VKYGFRWSANDNLGSGLNGAVVRNNSYTLTWKLSCYLVERCINAQSNVVV